MIIGMVLTCYAAQAQQVFKTTPGSTIGFLEYLPADYNTNSDKYPIVIFLHGLGERGPDTDDVAQLKASIETVKKHGPTKHVNSGTQFPFILISPQLKNRYGDWPTPYVLEVLDYVKTYLRVDERRIYLTGLSLGGGGTWTVTQNNPTLFAAIAPVCGSKNSTSKAGLLAAENLPVWAFHGDKDTTVPMSRSVAMVNAINNCAPTPNPKALLTIYPGVGHNAWDKAYTPNTSYHNPNVYTWMMSYTNTVNAGNKVPIANAGTDQTISSSTLSLNGNATDADGTIASYSWTKLSGGNVTMTNSSSKEVGLSGMTTGTYVFRLRVTDNSGNTDSDYVKVTIGSNQNPVANAGADKSITLPTSSVSLTGTATDADGTIASYTWSSVSGPSTVTLTNATSSTVSASNLTVAGVYTLKLTVKDNSGATHADNVNITVNPAPVKEPNAVPVANAGSDKTITLPTTSVSIAGSGTDSDGTIASYTWTSISGPSTIALGNATASTVSLSGLTVAGTYTLRLTVKDNYGATDTDDVNIIVNAAAANVAPKANAGKDIIITLPASSVVITGSGTDTDGTIVSYTWKQVSGPLKASMSSTTSNSFTASGMTATGFYVFMITVKDNNGATATDKMGVKVLAASGTSASARMADTESITMVEEPVLQLSATEESVWKNKYVSIYNQSGARLYSGKWSSQAYTETFSQRGIYLYNIRENGKIIKSGKIAIVQ